MKACRLDKFVWSVRLGKTRSIASTLISKGKIRLNNSIAKPSKEVKLGDEINIIKHTSVFTYRIIQLLDKRVGAKLVSEYLVDITSVEEVEKFKLFQANQRVYREKGSGKPSKKDRRDLDNYLNSWED